MKNKLILGSFIVTVVIGLMLGFNPLNSSKHNVTKYKMETVHKGDIQDVVITTGILNPVILVDVGSQVSGAIEKVYVDFNSEVRQGQVIAEIDQSSFLIKVHQNEANYQSALASLEKAQVTLENSKKKLERSLELFDENLISYEEKENSETSYFGAIADLQSAEARLEEAKSQLESSKVELNYTVIRSPIDGIVINKNINIGQTVAASLQAPVLFQIANDLTEMRVECSVDETDIGKVKENQKVIFTVDAYPEKSFTGTVTQVRYSPEIIQNVVTYTTIVEVKNPDMMLRPGMTATVSVIVDEAMNTLRVPNSALLFTPHPGSDETKNEDISRIWTVDENGKLKPISIKTGITDSSYTEVIEGTIQEGQMIITGFEPGAKSNQSTKNSDSMRNMMRALS